jgi:sialidase-1
MKIFVIILICVNVFCVSVTTAQELVQGDQSAFMDTPYYLYHHQSKTIDDWTDGFNIITTQKGTVLVNDGQGIRRSTDGGNTWSEIISIGRDVRGCNAVIDEATGAVLLVNPTGYRFISHDDGLTWKREAITVLPNLIGHGSSEKKNLNAFAMQPGITLTYGKHLGRLIMPVRWLPSEELPWRPYIYNTAIYSDDHGKTWQTTAPFPVFGTGEAALAEISDGRILYSSREHMSQGNRFFAWSYDGGERWLNYWRSKILPDGARGTSYGCFGGLIRLPVKDRDILLYSNVDTDKGIMPPIDQAGASRGQLRENLTVWASFDGGETWPVKKLVFAGESGYSTLGVGRPSTSSQGRIYILFDGCKNGVWGTKVTVFNLSWLLNGEKTGNGEVPEWIVDSR